MYSEEEEDRKLRTTFKNKSVPPATVGLEDFKISGLLGVGGFGSVWNVSCSGKQYAMKQHFTSMYEFPGSLLLEMDILITLDPHPNIVELVHAFYDVNVFFVFELCLGTLCEVKDFCQFPLNAFMTQMGDAFIHMRRHGIVHYDVKPDNILVAKKTFKLCDMGCARYVPENSDYFAKDWYGVGVVVLWLHLTLTGQNDLVKTRKIQVSKALLDLDPLLKANWTSVQKLVLEGLLATDPSKRPKPESWKLSCSGEDTVEISMIELYEPETTGKQFRNWPRENTEQQDRRFSNCFSYSNKCI